MRVQRVLERNCGCNHQRDDNKKINKMNLIISRKKVTFPCKAFAVFLMVLNFKCCRGFLRKFNFLKLKQIKWGFYSAFQVCEKNLFVKFASVYTHKGNKKS